jgi:hypothetical protein
MRPKPQPQQNRCDCGRVKARFSKACKRCVELDSINHREVVGFREKAEVYDQEKAIRNCNRFFRERGMAENEY